MPVDYLEDARTAAGDGGVAGYAAPQAYHASNVFMADLWARDDKQFYFGYEYVTDYAEFMTDPESHATPGPTRAT
ncbi:hypothetical protein JL720_16869 [Aureococcus anophagefferens]|nr:hypothetical protein JL720_16869 [Aureococcus anophagefferens]